MFINRILKIIVMLIGVSLADPVFSQTTDLDGNLEINWTGSAYGDPIDHYHWSYTINGVEDSVTGTSTIANPSDNSVQLINVGDWAVFTVEAVSIFDDTSAVAISDTVFFSISVDVEPGGNDHILPSSFQVQAFPNPVSQSQFFLNWSINKADRYDITIYDILGRKVKSVVNKRMIVGEYEEIVQQEFAPGIYFAVIKNSDSQRVVKLSIIR